MAATFLLWPPAQDKLDEPTDPPTQLFPVEPRAPAKPKAQRAQKKQVSRKKPQRGLGVAQLERLRLQDRWKRLADSEPPPPAIHDQYLLYGGGGGLSAVRSVIHDQYLLDRIRMSAGSVVPLPTELPSSQIRQCLSDHCDLCLQKRRFFGGNQSITHYLGMPVDHQGLEAVGCDGRTKGKSVSEREVKEYEFFPNITGATAANGDDHLDPVHLTIAAASSSPNLPAISSPTNFLDLTLKLSPY